MRRWLPPLVLASVVVTGCGTASSTSGTVGAAQDAPAGEDLDVVAAVYPFAWVAGRIAPGAEVNLLNEGAQEAHDLDLSPVQRAAIETADVVLYTGDIGYQPQVEEAVSSAGGEVVSATEVAGEAVLPAAGGEAHAHEGEEPHEGEGVDPHLWFSPSIMADVAVAAGDAFAAADPDNAETYQQNAAELRDELVALGEDLEAAIGQDCRFDEAIVSHAAYGYLLQPFDKAQHAVTGVGAGSDASAGELAEIVGEIRAEGFTHVLAEPVEGRAGAEAVVAESGVEMLEILPLDAVSPEQAEVGLPDLVRAQADAFATALGCE